MLNAKQAREQTEQSKIANFRKEIAKAIKHNIDKGRHEARIMGIIPPEIMHELNELEYDVDGQKGITVIRW